MRHFIFTITPGRTGTKYLKDLLTKNIPHATAYHENLFGFDKYGVTTPDVSHFHTFNSQGNTAYIQKFWEQKFTRISHTDTPYYIETSHLLAKAGLIENLRLLERVGQIHLILLTRNITDTLISHHKQNTFQNLGNSWLWYLDPKYPKNLLDPAPYYRFQVPGIRLWYLREMIVRQHYYQTILQNTSIRLHHCQIEDLNTSTQVSQLLQDLSAPQPTNIIIPSPQNTSPNIPISPQEHHFLAAMQNSIPFNPAEISQKAIQSGHTFNPSP